MLFFKRKKTGLRPYGLVKDDGWVQLGFSLPVPADTKGREAARMLARNMGLCNVEVSSMEAFGKDFATFVVYGETTARVNMDKIKIDLPDYPSLSFGELNRLVKEKIGRPIVIAGTDLAPDNYTPGIDGILSTKGLAGDCGLERYPAFRIYHLRREPSYEEWLAKAKELRADTIMVSHGSMHKNSLEELRKFVKVLKSDKEFYKKILNVCVETPFSSKELHGLGYHVAFAPRTAPSSIASFIVHEQLKRMH